MYVVFELVLYEGYQEDREFETEQQARDYIKERYATAIAESYRLPRFQLLKRISTADELLPPLHADALGNDNAP